MSSLRTSRPRHHGLRSSRGFSMVEVLVAIVILSIGVLGAVGMQAAGMRNSREVRSQALAGSLARELAEKMRGNHRVAIQTTTSANPYLLDRTLTSGPGGTALTAPSPNCYSAACTTGLQVAAWDIYEWSMRVRDTLPNPRVRVCMDSDPFDSANLPKWDCNGTGNVAVLKMAWNRSNTVGELEFTSTALPMLVLPLTAGSSE